jgi:hypothetical protein
MFISMNFFLWEAELLAVSVAKSQSFLLNVKSGMEGHAYNTSTW